MLTSHLNGPICVSAPDCIVPALTAGSSAFILPVRVKDARADEIAIISHELRNSLGVVRNAARLLRLPGTLAVETARVLLERHVTHMNRHVQDLLDASQNTTRKGVLRTHVDLRAIVANSIDAIALDLARRGHRLLVKLPADGIWLHADGARLEQVFSNLLINAAKYTPDGGDISLTMERIDRMASVRIRDSGIGIAPASIERIFDMFVQVDATTPLAEGGRGIGLAVVRKLIELHGGSVCAVSEGLGFGSEFAVLLPALWSASGEPLPLADAR